MFFLVVFLFPQLTSSQSADICTGSRPAKNDHKLIGHVMNTLTAPSGSACFDQCRATTGCNSISYKEETKTCHLNNANHLTNPESLVPSAGFLYMNVNTVDPPLACSDKYCPDSNVCVYRKENDVHECLPCEVAKRSKDRYYLHFPKNSVSDKVVLEKLEISPMTAWTVSAWFQIKPGSASYYSIFQYVVNIPADVNEIGLGSYSSSFAVIVNDVWITVTGAPFVVNGYWHHVTVTWQSSDGELNVYFNGTKVFTKTAVKVGRVVDPGVILLGQEADSFVGSFVLSQAFDGNMTSVNMWNRVLPAHEITALSQSCTYGGYGNVVRWAELRFKGEGMVTWFCSPVCT